MVNKEEAWATVLWPAAASRLSSLPHLTSGLDIFSCPLSQKQVCPRSSPAGLAQRLPLPGSSELGLTHGVVSKAASALFDFAEPL